MRKEFVGLSTQAEAVLKADPYSGHPFVFRGRRGDLIKVIWWDGQGACLFSKRKPKRRPLPDRLPRNETVLPAGEAWVSCGGKLKPVGEDVTEELDYVPGRFVVNRLVRPRMARACCETFHQAPLPSRPIERGRPGPGLLAHVLVNKFADHPPLYRQSQILARDSVASDITNSFPF